MENREFDQTPKCPVFGCTIPRGIPHEHPQQQAGIERFLDGIPLNRLDQFEGGPMIPGRNLRDALLMGGHNEWCARRHIDPVSGETFEAIDRRELLAAPPAPRRTLAQSIGMFMAWMFSIPALALAAFAIGEYCGWWI